MGGRSSKLKGSRGENEFAGMLWFALGQEIKRKLGQAREGGEDIDMIPGVAIEVKRQETLNLAAWWRQVRIAAGTKKIPVLAYRQNHRAWVVCLPASLLARNSVPEEFISISFPTFVLWLKQFLNTS